AVGHVQQRPLGAGDDRPDADAGALVDEGVDGEAEEVLGPFRLKDASDGGGGVHVGGSQRNRDRHSGLTTWLSGHSPRPSATMDGAPRNAMSSRACRSTPAVWAVQTTFSKRRSGWSAGGGSSANTSRPAPAIRPSSSARTRSTSETSPPRAVLIRNAVGFI